MYSFDDLFRFRFRFRVRLSDLLTLSNLGAGTQLPSTSELEEVGTGSFG